MRKLRVGVIGCGWVSNGHIAAWRKVSDVEVASVCDIYEESARAMATKWGVHEYYKEFTDLLEKSDVDIIDICTPPQTHMDFMVKAMNDGVCAITEKPMTMTVKEAEAIVDAKNRTGVKAGVIHNWLYEPTILEARKIVKDGALGEIINVELEAMNTPDDPMVTNKNHWCHKLVGGRISEMLPHPIYLIREFLGTDASVNTVFTAKVGEYPWMKSDEMCAIFSAKAGLGRAYASFNSPRDTIFVNVYGKEAQLRTDIINATLTFYPKRENERLSKGFDSMRQAAQLTSSTVKNIAKIASGSWNSGVDEIIKRFAEAIRNDTDPPVTLEEGLEVTKVLENMALLIDKTEKERAG